MAVANEEQFIDAARTSTWLAARGFAADGRRSGGIKDPRLVTLPRSAILVRLFHEPKEMVGQWWSTPFELAELMAYFARSGPAFASGRPEGKGILHAALAVRHDWAGSIPVQLGQFVIVRLREALTAYYGEGDDAPHHDQRTNQKAVMILDSGGRQRVARQVYLPKAWRYAEAFESLATGVTDIDLPNAVRPLAVPLPFEA